MSTGASSAAVLPPRIGVLALQGDFAEHIRAVDRAGGIGKQIRYPSQLLEVDGLIIPGGESTTISKLLHRGGFERPIKDAAADGFPIWGTCAGLIVIAERLADSYPVPLGLVNITVSRNWFGRQKESFEADLSIKGMTEKPFRCVFIRAPLILETGEELEILATLPSGHPVAVRQGNIIGTAFHPELTDDPRFHSLFVHIASNRVKKACQILPAL